MAETLMSAEVDARMGGALARVGDTGAEQGTARRSISNEDGTMPLHRAPGRGLGILHQFKALKVQSLPINVWKPLLGHAIVLLRCAHEDIPVDGKLAPNPLGVNRR